MSFYSQKKKIVVKNTTFSYNNIQKVYQNKRIYNQSYTFAVVKQKNFIGLCYIGGINKDSKIINNAGWKFHVSLNDTISGNVQRGWDSIVDILIKHKIQQSKVIKSNYKVYDKQRDQNDFEKGKQIVIYAYGIDANKKWKQILQEITTAFLKNQVIAGKLPKYNRIVKGSTYISYCNDAAKYGKKAKNLSMAKKLAMTNYNPYNNILPTNFKKLKVIEVTKKKQIIKTTKT